jgi:hypothetical protein
MPRPSFFRQIHLDFHTSPAIGDVACDFDAEKFAQTMLRANVNSVNLFAKCHHGHLYYQTTRKERHPGLSNWIPLLEQQVDALHRHGIKTPIYISVQCDEYAANLHPEWVALQPDGSPVGAGPTEAGWTILDMSSGYQDYLYEQTTEILERFNPVDGIWFDMCWDQTSSSQSAIAGMLAQGLNPEIESDREMYANTVSKTYMHRFSDLVKSYSPNALIFFNCRPFPALREEIDYFEQIEIEALPTGGWGYLYFPTNVRYLRNLGKPVLGMTARFHKSWADFGGLKPEAALIYETAQMVAHGATCCIGDQLHPRGTLDDSVYDRIGSVYSRIKDREEWLIDARPVTQVAVFTPKKDKTKSFGPTVEGAVRMLTQLKVQFDIVDRQSSWKNYDLVILPDYVVVTPDFASELSDYISKGGKILATGYSGLSDEHTSVVSPELFVKPEGDSPFTATYIRLIGDAAVGEPATDHVMYDRGIRVTCDKAFVIARVVDPYFERTYQHFSSHAQTPSDKLTEFAAAAANNSVGYVSYPIFSAFAEHGNPFYRSLVSKLLNKLIDPLVQLEGPTGTEVTLTCQPGRTIMHVLHFSAERRSPNLDLIEDIVPLYNAPVSLKMRDKPVRVTSVPESKEIEFSWIEGRVHLIISEVNGHAMIVFEE